MNTIIQISLAVICLFIIWRIYGTMKANPNLFSKENLSKSFATAGVLALILIGFVVVLVFLLKS
jgi:hypothetical protein